MAINNVGSYTNYAALRSGAAAPTQGTSAYTAPTAPAVTSGGAYAPQASGLNLGRMAAWGGGAFAAWKLVMPMLGRSPGGLLVGGVLGAGALAGNWIYSKLTGGGSTSAAPLGGGGQTLKYASWAGGALAAWKGVLPMLGRSPGGLVVAGVLGAGAFAGGWVYNKLTGR